METFTCGVGKYRPAECGRKRIGNTESDRETMWWWQRTASAWRPIFIPKQMGVQLQTSHTSAHNTNNFYIRNTSNIHLLVVWLATAHSLPVPIVTTVLHWRLLWCTGYNRIPVFDLLSHDTVWSFEKTLRILQFLGISPVCLLTYWSKW